MGHTPNASLVKRISTTALVGLYLIACCVAKDYSALIAKVSQAALAQPHIAVNWRLIGDCIHDSLRFEGPTAGPNHAIWCYSRALRADPSHGLAALGMASIATGGHWFKYRRIWPSIVVSQALKSQSPTNDRVVTLALADAWFTITVFAPTPQAQLRAAQQIAANYAEQHRRVTGGFRKASTHQWTALRRATRLHIGHISPHFAGSVYTAMQSGPAIAAHDRLRFKASCYYISEDAAGERSILPQAWQVLEETSEAAHDISSLSDDQAALRLQQDALHIAMDHGGYCRYARPSLFHFPVAPIHVNYPCMLATLGAPRNVSAYFISQQGITPPAIAPYFSEALVLLPHYHFTEHAEYFTTPAPQAVKQVPLFVFAMLNSMYKLCPRMMNVLVNIVTAAVVPSVLWVKQHGDEKDAGSARSRDSIKREALARGLGRKQMRWKVGQVDKQSHIVESAQGDIFLDTQRVNAVWTAFDALWAGLPLLSISGDVMASRVSASLLRSVGLGNELAVSTLKGYQDLAQEMAKYHL